LRFLSSFLLLSLAFTTDQIEQEDIHDGKTGEQWAEVMRNAIDQKEKVRAGISERSQDRCLLSSIAM
jgi:hypothetical protein